MGQDELPLIAVTMGDPAGIGPEICLRLLAHEGVRALCRPVVFGDAGVLEACGRAIGLGWGGAVVSAAGWEGLAGGGGWEGGGVLDLGGLAMDGLVPGRVGVATGLASYRYIDSALGAALAGEVAAVVTGPIHKEALRAAGVAFPGHTEIFAARTRAERSCMFQFSDEVRASFVTTHVGYHEVPGLLTVGRILDVIELTAEACERLRGPRPRLAVLGLNPHAGEHGLFGRGEEEEIIGVAVAEAVARGIWCEGPVVPDTAFLPRRRKEVDAFVCMYHDQGHIPLKALAFDRAVNVTLGLPVVRTSVDHGTACDIAWRGEADAGSLVQAVELAVRLARGSGGSGGRAGWGGGQEAR